MSSDTKPGILVVSRTSPHDIGIRDLYVVVDDLEEQTLLNGESLTLNLEPGEHTVKVTNRLFNKKEVFKLSPGETVRFVASNKAAGGFFSVLVVLGGTGAYKVTLERA